MNEFWKFLADHGVEIVLGLATLALGYSTLRLSRRQHDREVDEVLGKERKASIYLSRPAMARALLDQYKRARDGDVIWGQCVGCDEYTPEVGALIVEAAAKGVNHRLIANAHAPTARDFQELFAPLRTAQVAMATDNKIRVQGISSDEVIISIPELTQYTAISIRDTELVGIIREWFDRRFASLEGRSQEVAPKPSAPRRKRDGAGAGKKRP